MLARSQCTRYPNDPFPLPSHPTRLDNPSPQGPIKIATQKATDLVGSRFNEISSPQSFGRRCGLATQLAWGYKSESPPSRYEGIVFSQPH